MIISVRSVSRASVSEMLPQAERARIIARTARQERDDLVRSGRAPSSWRTLVDGREGVPEESIRPGGAIVYRFNVIGEAAIFALTFCIARSPNSGPKHGSKAFPEPYKRRWFVAVDGRRWTGELRDIPAGAEVMISNDQPYSRRIETGGQRVNVPPYIIEDARRATMRKFPSLKVSRAFVTWPGAYVLKNRKSMTYPALVITQG